MKNLIPHYRRQRKVKQTEMARELNVSPSFLCKVEKGLAEPSMKFKAACSEFLDVPESVLFPQHALKIKNGEVSLPSGTEPGNLLWQIRIDRGIKQNELARLLSCSPSFLSKVEKGLQDPGDEFKKKCARIFKIKQTVLFP